MSLNGLDASVVVEAHQAALADPGGWFLLKYVNRDTVELLSRGVGGVIEAKNVIEQYEEKSPLYGLIQFRRKKVLLKYVPVGTSRLLQVRLTVQFQSVADAFPQDTVFSFSAPTELSESALSLSVMLQPAAHGSSPSSSAASVKHRRLDEISEDAEEQTQFAQREVTTPTTSASLPAPVVEQTPTQSIKSSYDSLPPSALRAKALLARRKEAEFGSNAGSVTSHTRGADSLTLTLKSVQLSSLDKSLPATPELEPTPPPSHYGMLKGPDRPATPPLPPKSDLRTDSRSAQYSPIARGNHHHKLSENTTDSGSVPRVSMDHIVQQLHHSDHLSANESHSISQWNDQVTAYSTATKPKRKLAPRLHVESTFRPKTSNTVGMPNTVRASSRQNVTTPTTGYRPGSSQSSRSVPGRFTHDQGPVPPLPTSRLPPLYRIPEPPRYAPSIASSNVTESAVATPEKMRLMKALQKRKRNILLAQRSATSLSSRAQTSLDQRPEDDFRKHELNAELQAKPEVPLVPSGSQDITSQAVIAPAREHESSTPSPVSTATVSGAQSTKPSSVSGDADLKNSLRSSSTKTDSSAIAKASQEPEPEQVMSNDSDSPSSEEFDQASSVETTTAKSHVAKSSVDEAYMRLTGATEPEIPQTIVSQSSPTRENKETTELRKTNLARLPNVTLQLPPRTSSHGALLGFGRNSKHLTIQSTAARSSANVSIYSDDSLMEEIQNATLHEAKPVSVARTPATPTMRKFSSDRIREMTQPSIPEQPSEPKTASDERQKPRSASMKSSSTVPHTIPEEPMPPLSNKATLGSSISKRIKALEVLTHRDSTHAPQEARETSGSKKTLSNLMNRASFIAQFHAPKPTEEVPAVPKKTVEPPRTATGIREVDLSARPLVQRQGEATELFAPSRKGETVSVTARIVREQRRPATSATIRNHENGLNLYRSPLIVEHARKASDSKSMSTMSRDISGQSIDTYSTVTADKPRVSFSSFRSGSTIRQLMNDGRSSRMSFMSRKSSRAPSETSSIAEERKANRAGRLMKRMSGLGSRFGPKGSKFGISKDQLPQQETILEQAEDDRRQSMAESLLQMIDIGDVNVQFPESLLWKRRFMRIDDQGYLIFSAPTDNVHIRTTARKFHLAEIKTPTLPDREREEMSWSIVLDLKEGSCIQCACESKHAQGEILKMLVDAHYAYNSLYTAS